MQRFQQPKFFERKNTIVISTRALGDKPKHQDFFKFVLDDNFARNIVLLWQEKDAIQNVFCYFVLLDIKMKVTLKKCKK